jgi:hypothetical protein
MLIPQKIKQICVKYWAKYVCFDQQRKKRMLPSQLFSPKTQHLRLTPWWSMITCWRMWAEPINRQLAFSPPPSPVFTAFPAAWWVTHLEMMKNDILLSTLYSANQTYPQSSQTLQLSLEKDDKVWMRNKNGVTRKMHDGRGYNVFSGFLINRL